MGPDFTISSIVWGLEIHHLHLRAHLCLPLDIVVGHFTTPLKKHSEQYKQTEKQRKEDEE